ncbi:hypothetical protein C1N53_16905 [Pontibacter sp. SGAir0037]|nr:hypothetical protein C1N53_16905 [Pontibacter sp. SGAir0037]
MKLFYTLLACLLTFGASAQQNLQYSQYIFNGMAINPAYTGSKNTINLNAFYRYQWTGVEGAPTIKSFTVDGAPTHEQLGLGLELTQYKAGAYSKFSAYANAAAKLPVSEDGVLSLGVAAGLVQHTIDGTQFGISNDPSIPPGKDNTIKPNVKLGLYYHTQRFYAGVSTSELVQYEEQMQIDQETNFYFTSGYVFDLGTFVKVKPSVLLKDNFKAPTSIDLNTFVLLDDKLWLGGSYRTSANIFYDSPADMALYKRTAFAFIAELQVQKTLRIGYAYDKMLNDMRGFHTHEVSVGYNFANPRKEASKIISPQYF